MILYNKLVSTDFSSPITKQIRNEDITRDIKLLNLEQKLIFPSVEFKSNKDKEIIERLFLNTPEEYYKIIEDYNITEPSYININNGQYVFTYIIIPTIHIKDIEQIFKNFTFNSNNQLDLTSLKEIKITSHLLFRIRKPNLIYNINTNQYVTPFTSEIYPYLSSIEGYLKGCNIQTDYSFTPKINYKEYYKALYNKYEQSSNLPLELDLLFTPYINMEQYQNLITPITHEQLSEDTHTYHTINNISNIAKYLFIKQEDKYYNRILYFINEMDYKDIIKTIFKLSYHTGIYTVNTSSSIEYEKTIILGEELLDGFIFQLNIDTFLYPNKIKKFLQNDVNISVISNTQMIQLNKDSIPYASSYVYLINSYTIDTSFVKFYKNIKNIIQFKTNKRFIQLLPTKDTIGSNTLYNTDEMKINLLI